jgi:transcriptional regulator with XRE-family HTH domain
LAEAAPADAGEAGRGGRVSQPYLAQLETGRRVSADIAVYAKLAKRLGVRIEDLVSPAVA